MLINPDHWHRTFQEHRRALEREADEARRLRSAGGKAASGRARGRRDDRR